MKISTKGRYALRTMVDIALHSSGSCITLKDISRRQDISVKYLEQIASQLAHAGLLRSNRGPQGGYRLSKDPRDYTAGEILRVTEGSLAPIPCLEADADTCKMRGACSTIDFWQAVYDAVLQVADNTTLEDLAEQSRKKLENGTANYII